MQWIQHTSLSQMVDIITDEILNTAIAAIRDHGTFKIGLPTGNTMIPIYPTLADKINKHHLKFFEKWICIPLDEYCDFQTTQKIINADHSLSFASFLNTHFFSLISSPPQKRYLWQTDQKEIQESILKGPMDLVCLGVGQNGHIAFNEPGSTITDTLRIVKLSENTIQSNFTNTPQHPTHAITLGIFEINTSKKIMVIANGNNKRPLIESLLQSPDSTQSLPIQLIMPHKSLKFHYFLPF